MEKVIIKNNDLHREFIDRIKTVIMKKTIFERKAQNSENKTILGNCSFWFQKELDGENYFLIFDKHISLWDIDRIKTDLENLEYIIYKQSIY